MAVEAWVTLGTFIAVQIIAAVSWGVYHHTQVRLLKQELHNFREWIKQELHNLREGDVKRNSQEIERLRKKRHNIGNFMMRQQSEIIQLRQAIESLSRREND